MNSPTTSAHADLRARKRYKKQDFTSEFEEALQSGKDIRSFAGTFKRYLERQAIIHRSNGVVYKNSVFWYNKKDSRLITVYPLHPKWHKYIKQED